MSLHVEVHAVVRTGEVGHVGRPVDRLARVVGLVHLDRVDVVVDVPDAPRAEVAGDRATWGMLDTVGVLAVREAACHSHRVNVVGRLRHAVERGRALLGDGRSTG